MALKSNIVALSKLGTPEEQNRAIFATLGDLDQYDLLDDDILVALYVPPNILTSGKRADGSTYELIGTENLSTETRWQGKIGIVVKLGPTAYKYHANGQPYEGKIPKSGDYVVFHAADGREIFLRDGTAKGDPVICRRIHWSLIGMRVKDPRTVR